MIRAALVALSPLALSAVATAEPVEVVSASFYTDPGTGKRVLLRYTVAGEPGVVGQTQITPRETRGPSVEQIEAAFAAGKSVKVETAFGIGYFTLPPAPVIAAPSPAVPYCPNGRCPLR